MNTPPYPIGYVELKEIIDELTLKRWNVYSCDIELVDGTVIEDCSVEADPSGTNVAFETLMDEAGNPFSTWTFPTLKSEQ